MHKSGEEEALRRFGPGKRWQAAFALLALLGVVMLSGTLSSTVAGKVMSAPGQEAKLGAVPTATPSPKLPDLGKIPIAFEPNAGQAPSPAQYLAHMPTGLLSFSPSQLNMS